MEYRSDSMHVRLGLAVIVLIVALGPTRAAEKPAAPGRILFDTDMDSDCDDVGALAVLHALADRGAADILATVVSSRHEWSPACADAINTFYGRPNLPIGCPKKGGAMKASK